jgi:hypothetical protein
MGCSFCRNTDALCAAFWQQHLRRRHSPFLSLTHCSSRRSPMLANLTSTVYTTTAQTPKPFPPRRYTPTHFYTELIHAAEIFAPMLSMNRLSFSLSLLCIYWAR